MDWEVRGVVLEGCQRVEKASIGCLFSGDPFGSSQILFVFQNWIQAPAGAAVSILCRWLTGRKVREENFWGRTKDRRGQMPLTRRRAAGDRTAAREKRRVIGTAPQRSKLKIEKYGDEPKNAGDRCPLTSKQVGLRAGDG